MMQRDSGEGAQSSTVALTRSVISASSSSTRNCTWRSNPSGPAIETCTFPCGFASPPLPTHRSAPTGGLDRRDDAGAAGGGDSGSVEQTQEVSVARRFALIGVPQLLVLLLQAPDPLVRLNHV